VKFQQQNAITKHNLAKMFNRDCSLCISLWFNLVCVHLLLNRYYKNM